MWLLRGSLALNGLLGLALARRLRRRMLIRAGRIQVPEQDFAAVAHQTFLPSEPGGVALVGDSHVALGPWLEMLTPYRNRGISGAKIADVLAWVDGVLDEQPAQLMLMIGSNDVFFDVPHAESLAAAETLLDHLAEHGRCGVTVVSVPPLASDPHGVRRLNTGLEKLAAARGFQWVDIAAILAGTEWTEDGLHLNRTAYRAVAPAIRAALETPGKHRSED